MDLLVRATYVGVIFGIRLVRMGVGYIMIMEIISSQYCLLHYSVLTVRRVLLALCMYSLLS